MRLWIAALAAGGSVLALAPAAQAQQTRHVNVEVQMTEMHDNNVARSSAAVAAARGVSRSDSAFSPSLVADIFLPVSRQSVFLKGYVGYDDYAKNDLLDASRAKIDGGANLNIGLCQGIANAGYSRAQSDLQDLTLLATRNIEKTTVAGLNMTCGRSAGLAPMFGISTATSSNSSPFLIPSDYHNNTETLGLSYRRPSLGVITVFGSHSDAEYRHRLILVGGVPTKDGYQTDSGGIRYERRLGARIGGEIELGYTKVKPDIPAVPDFKGTTYRGVVDFRVSSLLQTSLGFQHDVTPTIRVGSAYSENQTVFLNATYQLGSRFHLNGGVSQGISHYKGAALGVNDLTKEDITSVYGGVRWDVGRRVAFGSTFKHDNRNTNITGFDYSDTQVTVSAIGKF
jgi:hypothetical protein